MVTQAVTARKAGAVGKIIVRGDSAYGTHSVVTACLRAEVQFSVVMAKNSAAARAIDSIAEVAETTYTAFSSTKTPVTARRHPIIFSRVR